jgi:hypothetical protein
MLQLTKNLQLTSIDENNVQGDKLLAVACYFTFFGEEGVAYISTNKLDGDYPSYGMTIHFRGFEFRVASTMRLCVGLRAYRPFYLRGKGI